MVMLKLVSQYLSFKFRNMGIGFQHGDIATVQYCTVDVMWFISHTGCIAKFI